MLRRKGSRPKALTLCALAMAAALAIPHILVVEQVRAQSEPLAVTAGFTDSAVTPDARIELQLSRLPSKAEGRVAVLIGVTDVTNLFALAQTTLTYNPMIPLPVGESDLTVFLVSPDNEWKEIARFKLRVSTQKPKEKTDAETSPAEEKPIEPPSTQNRAETQNTAAADQPASQTTDPGQAQPRRFGFDKLEFTPALTVSLKSQPAQSSFPSENTPPRPVFTDLTLTGGIRWEMARGAFSGQSQFDFVGSSFRQEALRFGLLGDTAPRIDLASYLMQHQIGKARYTLGHTSYGSMRHLVNSFSSRGMTLSFPVSTLADVSLAAMNGTSIVGYDNFFGIAKRRHSLTSATLGLELIPKRPGGLRVETSVMSGWLQPLSNFTQGSVNDAERSRGLAFHVIGSSASGRFRLDGGFSRSQFVNPADPLLAQGQSTVEVRPLWRNARYLDVSYDLLREYAITKERKLNLSLAFRHERVDPLFRSLGASTQADSLANDFSANASIGEFNVQYAHLRFNDNLSDIASILKSITRGHTLGVAFPLASFFGDPQKPSPLLPRLSYNYNRVYQFGAAVPVNGGFEIDPASIPDLISTNQGVTADWQFQKFRVGYRLNHSLQNNRQTGSDLFDVKNFINGATLGLTPHPNFDLNIDINAESAFDRRSDAVNRTLRLAPGLNWRLRPDQTLSSNISFTIAGDRADTRDTRNVELDIQYSVQFGIGKDRFRKLTGQMFIRYATQYARARDLGFGLDSLTRNQTLNVGISFTFF